VPDLRFLDSLLDGSQPARAHAGPSEDEALDAYSTVVTTVAERLSLSVANLRVWKRVGGPRRVEGGGSAVVVTEDGFLLTSAHVVAGTDRGIATFVDGRELDLEIVGTDPLSDLAVVRASGSGLVAAALGDAARLRVGQLVVAIGNPLGFAGSLTAGVVSALGRSIPTRSGSVTRLVENVIQTDAALHPGNSGGALADGSSRVVGINTAVVGPGIGQGLGLAVPINEATRGIIAALMTDGRVRRAYLGIAGGPRPLPPRVASELNRRSGVEIVEVVPGSPASHAGLRPEDLVVAIDDEPVTGMDDVQRLMNASSIGRTVALTVHREGRTFQTSVIPAELTG
jgi:S1-C subfamily serine protease